MAVFDILNPPVAPDSDLDSDVSNSALFTIAGNKQVDIALGDWVDVDPTYMSPDPVWGYSFQVIALYEEYVGILFPVNPSTLTYAEVSVTPSIITNNYRRVMTA